MKAARHLFIYTLVFSTLLLVNLMSPHNAEAKLLIEVTGESSVTGEQPGFLEDGEFYNLKQNGDETGWGPGSSITTSTEHARTGEKSIKFTVNYTGVDPNYPNSHLPDDGRDGDLVDENLKYDTYRALMHGHHILGGGQAWVPQGKEFWVGFSTFYPEGYEIDKDKYGELHFQVKQASAGPMVALHVGQKKGFKNKTGARDFNSTVSGTPSWNGAFETNQWVDWVYHFKLSTGNDGFVKVWRAGKIIVDFKGQTTELVNKKHTMAFGIYRYSWRDKGGPARVDKRTIYMDDIRVGDWNSSYAEVAPAGGEEPPPPPQPPADPPVAEEPPPSEEEPPVADEPPPPSQEDPPASGAVVHIPGSVEAEDYNIGENGSAYFDKTEGNKGNQYRSDDVDIYKRSKDNYVVATSTGEWLEYTLDVDTSGPYKITVVAAAKRNGRKLSLEFDGSDRTGAMTFVGTDNYSEFQEASVITDLEAGQQVMRLKVLKGQINIDSISIEEVN